MKLPYYLFKSQLTGSEGKYLAQIENQEVLSLEALAYRMAHKNTSLSASDISACFLLAKECIIEAIEEGYAVDTLTGKLKYSISGVFEDPEDGFDKKRHKLCCNVSLDKDILQAMQSIHVEKLPPKDTGPYISTVRDATDENADANTLRIGGVAKLLGQHIKIADNGAGSTDQGLFFIATDHTETRAQAIIDNNPSKLTIMVPGSLSVGSYHVELRSYYAPGKSLKQLRVSQYHDLVDIVA